MRLNCAAQTINEQWRPLFRLFFPVVRIRNNEPNSGNTAARREKLKAREEDTKGKQRIKRGPILVLNCAQLLNSPSLSFFGINCRFKSKYTLLSLSWAIKLHLWSPSLLAAISAITSLYLSLILISIRRCWLVETNLKTHNSWAAYWN